MMGVEREGVNENAYHFACIRTLLSFQFKVLESEEPDTPELIGSLRELVAISESLGKGIEEVRSHLDQLIVFLILPGKQQSKLTNLIEKAFNEI